MGGNLPTHLPEYNLVLNWNGKRRTWKEGIVRYIFLLKEWKNGAPGWEGIFRDICRNEESVCAPPVIVLWQNHYIYQNNVFKINLRYYCLARYKCLAEHNVHGNVKGLDRKIKCIFSRSK
jgi:hypothetical protein